MCWRKTKKKTRKTRIKTLRLSYIEYSKERKGADLDKLVLCPLKVKNNK